MKGEQKIWPLEIQPLQRNRDLVLLEKDGTSNSLIWVLAKCNILNIYHLLSYNKYTTFIPWVYVAVRLGAVHTTNLIVTYDTVRPYDVVIRRRLTYNTYLRRLNAIILEPYNVTWSYCMVIKVCGILIYSTWLSISIFVHTVLRGSKCFKLEFQL